VLVVVADGIVIADSEDWLLNDNTEDPVVCLGFIFLGAEISKLSSAEVVLYGLRSANSSLARLGLVEGVCEVVESCVTLS
jgi:hypothetical protein